MNLVNSFKEFMFISFVVPSKIPNISSKNILYSERLDSLLALSAFANSVILESILLAK